MASFFLHSSHAEMLCLLVGHFVSIFIKWLSSFVSDSIVVVTKCVGHVKEKTGRVLFCPVCESEVTWLVYGLVVRKEKLTY